MADTQGMADIRGLDIDRLAKGFAEEQYVFKNDCTIAGMSGDSIRWFQKTAGTLTATTPSATTNIGRLSNPTTLEVSWTRNTSYPKKFMVEGFLAIEDINGAEIDVLATTIRDLTMVITRDIDAHIWDVMSESQSAVNIQTVATTATWDAASYAADIVKDLMTLKKMIRDYNYDPEGGSLYLSPTDYKNMIAWLISGKGSSIPGFSSEKITSGTVMQLLGFNIKVSNNVTDDYALAVVPKRATTYREKQGITAQTTDDPGIGKRVRIWAHGIAYNTDPKAIVLLTNTQA